MNIQASHLRKLAVILGLGAWCFVSPLAQAAVTTIPGPADIGRVKPEDNMPTVDHSQEQQITIPNALPTAPIPEGAKKIHLVLHDVHLEGVTAFKPEQLRDTYASYLSKDITLDVVYKIAGAITERYRNAGYFLSLAYVPPQRIKGGEITIKVIEGSVGQVEMNSPLKDRYVVRSFIDHLLAIKPLKADEMESFLLRLNDLPGYSFRAVLSPLPGAAEGSVKLTLIPTNTAGRGNISFDNYGSRYLGPNEGSASYSASLLPLQQTTVSGLTTLPFEPLHYATLDHAIVIAPNVTFDVNGNATKAYPGYTLEPQDIKSESTYLNANLAWQWIRQRQENLSFKLTLDGRNTNTDIIDNPLVRDRVRALRGNISYDVADDWRGYNNASFTLSHGLSIFGASKESDPNLSRAGAIPDFTKMELSASRQQGITDNWSVVFSAASQWASNTLYSSEEFGYGGQVFGRAFDASEITGDKGISGAVELRYAGVPAWHSVTVLPYTFYDIGTVWNYSVSQPTRESAASAGFGMRESTPIGLSGNIGLAWPLTHEIVDPIYGSSDHGPRILLQVSQGF